MDAQMMIANRYRVEQTLGQGGMGTVYLAHDIQTQLPVAIKHLNSTFAEPGLIERFRREGQALRDLNHPNIVKLLDMIVENDEHYLVVEYVAGGDLAERLRLGKLDTDTILRYALDLADALTRAHKLNIIHRDLKPANILLGDDSTLRLTDFGIAWLGNRDRVTETNAIIGTINYLPPEAFNKEGIDTRSDIWAFGIVLYEMLTGDPPFHGDNIMEVIRQISFSPIPDLETKNSSIPIALIDLIYRMLERNPQSRISSVRYVGAILEDILEGRTSNQPITHRFDTPPEFNLSNPSNLPAQTTPFVGRKSEIGAITQLIQQPANRLITILAPGGMGKTRLSIEVARQQRESFEQGVYFVELAPLTHIEDIATTIGEAVRYSFQSDARDARQQLLDFLESKSMLLILDNFEHLIEGADIVGDLLKYAPKVKIMVTSRQRLSQPGETLYHLSGMEFTTWKTPGDALAYGVVQLFLQSAKRIQPEFELTQDNLNAVAHICQSVQGMPLGIVLSASWLGMLSPTEIIEELTGGIDFLETDETLLPERQRSIRKVFDYSWQHMTPAEQSVFMKFSVFRGGLTREAASDVADANLKILRSLNNKSLIHRDADTGRYSIHELLRQYAEEQLENNQLTSATHQAHVGYFAKLADSAEDALRHANQEHWFRLLELEHDNIRVAMDWAVKYQVPLATKMIIDLRDFWFYQGHHIEAYAWMSQLRHHLNVLDVELQGRLLNSIGVLAWAMQDTQEALTLTRQGVEVLRGTEYQRALAWAILGQVTAMSTVAEQHEKALRLSEEAIALFKKVDDLAGLAVLYNVIGNTYEYAKQYDTASEYFEKCIEISRQTGEMRRVAMNMTNIARIKVEQEEYIRGLHMLKEATRLNYSIGVQYILVQDMAGFVQILIKLERFSEASVLAGAISSITENLGVKMQPTEYAWWEHLLAEIHDVLDDADSQKAWHEGKKMTYEDAVNFVLNIKIE